MFKSLIKFSKAVNSDLNIYLFGKFVFKCTNIADLFFKLKLALLFVYLHYQPFSLIDEIL